MTAEDFDTKLADFSKQSFCLGAQAFVAYLVRMRLEMHERRLKQVKGSGPALRQNRVINAYNDVHQYRHTLLTALDALFEDADDCEAMEDIAEDIQNITKILQTSVA